MKPMITMLRWAALRLAAVGWTVKTLAVAALIVPAVLVLQFIGWPLLAILGVLALPVLFVLFLFGLPVFLVLLVGGMLLGLVGAVLSIGLVALKFALIVVLPIWLVWQLGKLLFGRRRGADQSARVDDVPAV